MFTHPNVYCIFNALTILVDTTSHLSVYHLISVACKREDIKIMMLTFITFVLAEMSFARDELNTV